MFFVIRYPENGEERYGDFGCYADAENYAQSRNGGYQYEITKYESYEKYEQQKSEE